MMALSLIWPVHSEHRMSAIWITLLSERWYKKYTCTDGCIDGIIGLARGYHTGTCLYSVQRFLLLQGPFFMLDGSLCMGYNMLIKEADTIVHTYPFPAKITL